jgi:hypothetical protein
VRHVGDGDPNVGVTDADAHDQPVLAGQAQHPPTAPRTVGEHDQASLVGELTHEGRHRGGRQTGLSGHCGLGQLTVKAEGRQDTLAVSNPKR